MRGAGLLLAVCALAVAGCGGGGNDQDAGHVGPGMDSGMPEVDAFRGGHPDVGAGLDGGCIPSVEICGDFMDENCDGHEASCGDHDSDTFDACSPSDTDLTRCDCDDSDPHTFPARGALGGGIEQCDSKDNDCDGRVDEAAACCPACMALGEANRGNLCTTSGQCACTTNAGMAPCGAGQVCCSGGCVDTTNDVANCGSCGFACSAQADRCVNSTCYCGPPPGVACMFTTTCHAGSCS